MKEEVSRQRLAQIRCYILRDIIGWTLREPHRLVGLKAWWNTFHWLVYKREQKHQDGKKHCVRCEDLGRECWHPVDDFYQNTRDKKHNLSDYCKQCCSERGKLVRKKNPEGTRESVRRWNEEHPEKSREYNRRKYAKNPEKHKQASRRWQRENAERWNAYSREYRNRKKAEREQA